VTDTKYDILSTAGGALLASPNSNTRWGAVVGAVSNTLRAELVGSASNRHMFMDGRPSTSSPGRRGCRLRQRQQDVDLFTARLNYKFGGPVIAKSDPSVRADRKPRPWPGFFVLSGGVGDVRARI